MRKLRTITAVLLTVTVTVLCFTACAKKVHNEEVSVSNGGVSVSDTADTTAPASDGGSDTTTAAKADDGKTTTAQNPSQTTSAGQKTTKKEAVTKPKAPKIPGNFKITKTTDSTIELSWDKVDCSGYIIRYSVTGSNAWITYDEGIKNNKITVKKLESMTQYSFLLYSYNENEAGKTPSEKHGLVNGSTNESNEPRKRTIHVKLPFDSRKDDTVNVYIAGKKEKKAVRVKTADVKLDGSTFTFTTDKKYAGAITVVAELEKEQNGKNQTVSDKKDITVDISGIGIDVIEVED